jgi:MoaA/NifB/PqqE/SkfB family radical SAM enzyme
MGPVQMCRHSAYPRVLEICLPDRHCNIGGENPSEKNPACIMCIRNFRQPVQPNLIDLLCRKAKPLMPYLHQLCVLGIAEPFWKNAVFDIFQRVEFHRYKSHIQFFTNTNGVCLKANLIRRFFEEVDWSDLAWSFDAASRETYRKIRRLDTFDRVTENLLSWIRLRDEYGGADHHQVSIYNNINLLNVHEMTEMVELAARWGVHRMTMIPTYDQAGVVQLGELVLCKKNVDIFRVESEKAKERAGKLGIDLSYSKPFDVVPPSVTPPVSPGNML